jgi:hypothetical protein
MRQQRDCCCSGQGKSDDAGEMDGRLLMYIRVKYFAAAEEKKPASTENESVCEQCVFSLTKY